MGQTAKPIGQKGLLNVKHK